MLKVIIADDNSAMRQVLRGYLANIPGIEIVAESSNGVDTLRFFEDLRPHCVLLDIDMPGMTGLEVAQEIFDIDPWTYIVFCTGHTELREKAFETYAFDFLSKPFGIEGFKNVFNRILYNELEKPNRVEMLGENGYIEVKLNDGLLLYLNDIVFFTKNNRKTIAYLEEGKTLIVHESLGALEEQLNEHMFYRSHKSFLINLRKVIGLLPYGKSIYRVTMANSEDRPLLTWEKKEILERLISIIK